MGYFSLEFNNYYLFKSIKKGKKRLVIGNRAYYLKLQKTCRYLKSQYRTN